MKINYEGDIDEYVLDVEETEEVVIDCFDFKVSDLTKSKQKFAFTKLEIWLTIKNLEFMLNEIEKEIEKCLEACSNECSKELTCHDALHCAYLLEDFKTLYNNKNLTDINSITMELSSDNLISLIDAFEVANPVLIGETLNYKNKYIPFLFSLHHRFKGFTEGIKELGKAS